MWKKSSDVSEKVQGLQHCQGDIKRITMEELQAKQEKITKNMVYGRRFKAMRKTVSVCTPLAGFVASETQCQYTDATDKCAASPCVVMATNTR